MDQPRSASRAPRRFAGRNRQKLVLGGLAAAASVSLTGCDSTPDFKDAQFTTVAECTSAGYPDQLCQASYNAAYLEHQRTAPKFNSLASCETEWGTSHCQQAGSTFNASTNAFSSASYVPMLAGFVVAQQVQRRFYDTGDIDIDYYGGYGGYRGGPIYRNRSGSTVAVDSSSGKSVSRPVNVNTASVSRSGFGGMGFSRSSSSSYSGSSSHSSWGG